MITDVTREWLRRAGNGVYEKDFLQKLVYVNLAIHDELEMIRRALAEKPSTGKAKG